MTRKVLIYLPKKDDIIDRFEDILEKNESISKITRQLWEQFIEDREREVQINTSKDHPEDFSPNILASLGIWNKWFACLPEPHRSKRIERLKAILEIGEGFKND